MRHDSGRTVLKDREQRHYVIAVASGQDYFIGGNNSEIHGAGADHLHRRSPRATRENLHVQTMLRIRRGVESAEFRLGLPVQRQLQSGADLLHAVKSPSAGTVLKKVLRSILCEVIL